jgi:hypothetical protein
MRSHRTSDKPFRKMLMVVRLASALSAATLVTTGNAESISLQDLIGAWNYVSYAEIESPDKKIPVNARFDFRPDGNIVMTLSTGAAQATFSVDGDTIHYSDANGNQEWKVRSHEAGRSFVVEYRRALLFFERASAE